VSHHSWLISLIDWYIDLVMEFINWWMIIRLAGFIMIDWSFVLWSGAFMQDDLKFSRRKS
jgi:hypothetical protein